MVLNVVGIFCYILLVVLGDVFVDSVMSFYVLEYLFELLFILEDLYWVLRFGGMFVMEVFYVGDIFFNDLKSDVFKGFILWSQYFVLYICESLRWFLVVMGFGEIVVEGVQCYLLFNYLIWLVEGCLGGYKWLLLVLDIFDLCVSYEVVFNCIDVIDIFVVIV